MAPLNLSSFISFHLGSFLSSAMARGRAGTPMAATRVSSRQRAPPSQELVAAEPTVRGRGRGRGRGRRGARGRGGRGGAPASPPPAAPPPMEGHIRDQPHEFVIRLHRLVRRRLRLPTPFAREMELDPPQALRLHMRGCGNGNMWVDVDFPAPTLCIPTVDGKPSLVPIACRRGSSSTSN